MSKIGFHKKIEKIQIKYDIYHFVFQRIAIFLHSLSSNSRFLSFLPKIIGL